MPLIIEIVDERPTYGYRRVQALLNRKLAAACKQRVNHKMIYRIMKEHNLLLNAPCRRNNSRSHSGRIVCETSDQRWCSDGFEIKCDNGDKIRTIFVMDCCDREIISFTMSTDGYTSEMVQLALIDAVEKRFRIDKVDKKLEWLTDNGSCFIAKETQEVVAELGITHCFTPVRSPESNGMAEAFVKTIKRDYVSCNKISNAEDVMKQMEKWIDDYNEVAPHKGLGGMSPRIFRRWERSRDGNFPGAARLTEAA